MFLQQELKDMQQNHIKSIIRDKFKAKFRQNLTIKTKDLKFQCNGQAKIESPVKKRLRKMSENLKSFNNIDLRREISIKECFEDCYQLQQKVGEGGHSVVYKCRDLKSNQIFAVKFTRKNDPQNLESLKQQYRILASLDHQGILKGHFLFLNEKKCTCHLVCEYYDYPDLRYYMVEQKEDLKNQDKAGEILKGILQAVNYLHEQKVSHRDLKPENILYEEETGIIKIIDFEVAKMPRYTHQKLEMWTKAGTPSYRSPELLNGSYNELTDMWSIGVITYQMLTGKFPFKVTYEKNLVDEINNFIPDLSNFIISQVAKNFIMKLLKRDPKDRMSARQALSHPFILSKSIKTPASVSNKRLNNSFQIDQVDEVKNEKSSPKSRFYDQSVKYSFLSNIDKDIGIRFCQE